jgi:hypothetical protein
MVTHRALALGSFRHAFSNAPFPFDAPQRSVSSTRIRVPPDAILCTEQIARTESCSTCGLCWHSKRRVAFVQH